MSLIELLGIEFLYMDDLLALCGRSEASNRFALPTASNSCVTKEQEIAGLHVPDDINCCGISTITSDGI